MHCKETSRGNKTDNWENSNCRTVSQWDMDPKQTFKSKGSLAHECHSERCKGALPICPCSFSTNDVLPGANIRIIQKTVRSTVSCVLVLQANNLNQCPPLHWAELLFLVCCIVFLILQRVSIFMGGWRLLKLSARGTRLFGCSLKMFEVLQSARYPKKSGGMDKTSTKQQYMDQYV